jgi:hypothetical protein
MLSKSCHLPWGCAVQYSKHDCHCVLPLPISLLRWLFPHSPSGQFIFSGTSTYLAFTQSSHSHFWMLFSAITCLAFPLLSLFNSKLSSPESLFLVIGQRWVFHNASKTCHV